MDGEKRAARRKHLHYPARIVAGEDTPLVPCILTDISETGVRVSLQGEGAGELPETVVLLLSPTGVKRRCRVAWREGNEVGMEFVKAKPEPHDGRR
jgi:hypothetical protein